MSNVAKIFSIDGRELLIDNIVKSYKESLNTYDSDQLDELIKGNIDIKKFSDGEITTQFTEAVRGKKVFLVCSTNTSDNIMKLMLASDAARRASAQEIIAVMPYYGYARQDRKDGLRGPVGARVIANILKANGVNRVIAIDLHAEQIQGFFNMPVDHINAQWIFLPYIKELVKRGEIKNLTLCSPDAGGTKRVDKYYKRLNDSTMVLMSKRRASANVVESMELIGDVKGRDVIIIDDMVDTAGTLCKAAQIIMDEGASSVRAMCTHAILSGSAEKKLIESPLKELIISDTIDNSVNKEEIEKSGTKIISLTCASSISKIIKAINNSKSAKELIHPGEE